MTAERFRQKLVELFGERTAQCIDGCGVCDAWALFDRKEWGNLLALLIDVDYDHAALDKAVATQDFGFFNNAIDQAVGKIERGH
jgi:hypothetical protein